MKGAGPGGAESLLEAIEERAEKGPVAGLEAARFERAARALLGVDPAAAHAALGLLASLRSDVVLCRREHECALALRPDDPALEAAYAFSLRRLGLLPDALGRVEAALLRDPLRKRYLDLAVPLAYQLDAPELGGLLTRWRRLAGTPHPLERDIADENADAAAVRQGRAEIAHGAAVPWAGLRPAGPLAWAVRYSVLLSSAAAAAFRGLPPRRAARVAQRLDALAADPRACVAGLGRLTRSAKTRVGPVLILFDAPASKHEVHVSIIRPRR